MRYIHLRRASVTKYSRRGGGEIRHVGVAEEPRAHMSDNTESRGEDRTCTCNVVQGLELGEPSTDQT